MPDIREVSVALTGEQIAAMSDAVKAGEYATTDEIIQEAMDLWQSHRELLRADAGHLGRAWDAGKASGPATPLDFDQLRQEARQRLKDARTAGTHAG
ncbi:ribbon-helix-helix domain-containing protein [Niveispirillum sp. KHB5.9]|uniref:ribbon-helix-helix domain-containing protein n=1 Tax=Niveispirillum sp. KHB5.9 TaxID=3400269 RepID=UPI003A8B8A77